MSTKAEVLDVMYANIKHAVFQPCDKTTMVHTYMHTVHIYISTNAYIHTYIHTYIYKQYISTQVLVHFHLKDFILIGKKKHKDVQFFTEVHTVHTHIHTITYLHTHIHTYIHYIQVIESSLNLDGAKRSAYDPDEVFHTFKYSITYYITMTHVCMNVCMYVCMYVCDDCMYVCM